MLKLILVLPLAAGLAHCNKTGLVVSDFCRQIETIGYDKMLTKFNDQELAALKTDRKRALRDLRKVYDTNCTNPSN